MLPDKLKDVPMGVLVHVEEFEGTVENLQTELEFSFPELKLERSDVRALLRYSIKQREMDEHARNPTNSDVLSGAINRSLYREIRRITEKVDLLSEIAGRPNGHQYEIGDTGEKITSIQASDMLISLRSQLLEMKKSIIEQKRAEAAANQQATNVNIDLGDILSGALANVNKMQLPVDQREIVVE